ncbi:hypothetical protein PILCRDRAFT_367 [Piloderma croceum F 1598]|uniref:Uncharacterized protein n=1 Tax=Piloderma croceum (strain F 1598) TaxID=765440 RepID=A0A0C3GP09_PILCF|nr:hypothetical protein PILCRDRAFT_367 [Piloderma croceum F 1598]
MTDDDEVAGKGAYQEGGGNGSNPRPTIITRYHVVVVVVTAAIPEETSACESLVRAGGGVDSDLIQPNTD